MSSQKSHAKIGNEISKYLKVNKKYFMIGNLLPDQDKYKLTDYFKKCSQKFDTLYFSKRLPYRNKSSGLRKNVKPIDELRLNKKDIYTVRKYLDLPHCRIVDDSLYQILNENVLDEIFENSIAFIIQYLQAKK